MKAICFFDIESTGTDVVKDRIVSIAMKKVNRRFETLFDLMFVVNPEKQMTPENILIHGITNEEARKYPPFRERARQVHGFMAGCDLAGFNHSNFDIPILWEEFHRAGIDWNLDGVLILDVGTIFKKKEERTLAAAVQFYCGREHGSAHNAAGDVDATHEVLLAQLKRYPDLAMMSLEEVAAFSVFELRFDLAGKLGIDKDGDPIYNIGKCRGMKVKDDPSFAKWMLSKDFPTQTKLVLTAYLEKHVWGYRSESADQEEQLPFRM